MSTWHQRLNPQPLWHRTLWTVVSDPPEAPTCLMRFPTADEAEDFITRATQWGNQHMYTLPPKGE